MIQLNFSLAQDNWMEVIWFDIDQAPDDDTAVLKGLKHTSYHPTQLDILQADAAVMGTPLDEHMDMLSAWVESHVPSEPEPLTVADFEAALTAHLDATARARRYDSRITCALRAGYPGPFQAEGQAFAAWMDACNAQAYGLLAEVEAGTRPLPTATQALIDVLPPMVWPES